MYPQHHWGHDDVVSCDAILSSRPDTLLANGGVFLPSPPSSYMLPPLAGCPPPPADQLQAAALSPTMFRRAMSTGDLININNRDDREAEEQRVAPAPGRYSAEERRERIDKYRSKRNQRNFQKKITYACRKTLADSRPRVKGRFARNASEEADVQATATAAAPPQSESEWWPAEQEQEQDYELPDASINLLDDDEMLAAYLGVSSISLYSPSASTALPHHH